MKAFDFNSERILWSAYVNGDRSAFSDIYKNYSESLFQYGLKLTSDVEVIKDSVQDLFIELWNARAKKEGVIHIKTYLLRSLRYKILKSIQTKSHEPIEHHENAFYIKDKEAQIILEEIEKMKTYELRNMISNLPQRHQEVIHLKYYQGLSNDRISTILDINKQSVSNLLHRAISGLKKKYFKKSGSQVSINY